MGRLIASFVFLVVGLMAATTQETAQKIMGKNYIGIADVEKSLGVKYTPEQRKALLAVPYSEATLRETATSHVLVAGYPIKAYELIYRLLRNGVRVDDWVNIFFASNEEGAIAHRLLSNKVVACPPEQFRDGFNSWKHTSFDDGREKPWFDQNIEVKTGWYLLKKEIFFPQAPKSWPELEANGKKQEKLFSPAPAAKYEGVKFRELFYIVTIVRLARGEMLFTRTAAYSSEISGVGPRTHNMDGRGTMLVHFTDGRVDISNTYMYHAAVGYKKEPVLGRAALRKFD